MVQSEKDVQNEILKYLKKLKSKGHPIHYEKRQAGGLSYKRGIPDIYFIYYGLHFEVEVKGTGGELSSDQETYQGIFRKNHTPYMVIDDFKDFRNVIDLLINNKESIYSISKIISKSINK